MHMNTIKNDLNIEIELQIVSNSSSIPSIEQFQLWVKEAINTNEDNNVNNRELTIRIVDREESEFLKQQI